MLGWNPPKQKLFLVSGSLLMRCSTVLHVYNTLLFKLSSLGQDPVHESYLEGGVLLLVMLLFSSFFAGAVGGVRWELTGFGEGGDSTCDDSPLAAGDFMGPRNQEDRFKDERKCTQTNFSSNIKYVPWPGSY